MCVLDGASRFRNAPLLGTSLYRTIQRLRDGGLIAVRQTERDQQYPERTLYELTEVGRQAADQWLRQMLEEPRNEFPEFPAALSFASALGPDPLRYVLEQRREAVVQSLAESRAELEQWGAMLPRIVLLQTDYQQAAIAAELAWLDGVIEELAQGTLRWSKDDFAMAATLYREVMEVDPPQSN